MINMEVQVKDKIIEDKFELEDKVSLDNDDLWNDFIRIGLDDYTISLFLSNH